jgi:hypothetical protein
MAKKAQPQGKCNYCGKQYAKSGMTRHLKTCQARQAAHEKMAKKKRARETTLYHVSVTGKYEPQYWMHLEMSGETTLSDLDDFLRDIWLECCGHLSMFEIGHRHYQSFPEDNLMVMFPPFMAEDVPGLSLEDRITIEEDDLPEISEEEEARIQDIVEDLEDDIAYFRKLLNQVPDGQALDMSPASEAEQLVKKMAERMTEVDVFMGQPGNEKGNLLKQALDKLVKEMKEAKKGSPAFQHLSTNLMIMRMNIQMVNDMFNRNLDMDVPVSRAFRPKVKKIRYEYDFGSTTFLELKVVDVREGQRYAGDEIFLMARNEPLDHRCRVCAKPATSICTECSWEIDDPFYCEDCLAEHPHGEDMALPVVNSPRMGVCGYTGGAW